MKHRVFNISLFVIYITGMTGLMIWQGIGIDPSYDFLRGFADNLGPRADFVQLIKMEEVLFGGIPTIELQKAFYNPHAPSLLDFIVTIFYFLHFALPLSFGFMLWLYNRGHFRQFVTGILLLSYAGWVTFLVYPAAPPWLASKEGYLPGVHKILDVTLGAFPDKWNLPSVYHNFNPNPVAAMPSLHAAYPLMILLFALKFFKFKALLFTPFVAGVWISIVYLGEHYVIDIIAGAIYAIIFYFVAIGLHVINWRKIINNLLRKI